MKLLLINIFLILSFLFFNKAFASNKCDYTSIQEVTDMGPDRSQDGLGFCYAFAALALIQQKYCKQKGGCVYTLPSGGIGRSESSQQHQESKEDDQLSALDIIAIGNRGELVEGGFVEDVLRHVKKQGELARENCMPYSAIILADYNHSQSQEKYSWWGTLRRLYKSFQKDYEKDSQIALTENQCSVIDEIIKKDAIINDFEIVLESLKKSSFEEFVKNAIVPKECESNRVPLPDFTFRISKEFDPIKTKPIIMEKLKENKPVGVSLCSLSNSVLDDECGGHAVVISGARKKCCQGNCSIQFKIKDSSHGFWAKLDRNNLDSYSDLWVEEDEILRKIHFMGIRWREDTLTHPVLRWIE